MIGKLSCLVVLFVVSHAIPIPESSATPNIPPPALKQTEVSYKFELIGTVFIIINIS